MCNFATRVGGLSSRPTSAKFLSRHESVALTYATRGGCSLERKKARAPLMSREIGRNFPNEKSMRTHLRSLARARVDTFFARNSHYSPSCVYTSAWGYLFFLRGTPRAAGRHVCGGRQIALHEKRGILPGSAEEHIYPRT